MTEFVPDPNVPTNKNFLVPQKFRLLMRRAPGIQFFVQEAEPPGLTLKAAEWSTSSLKIPEPGETLDFDRLSVKFIIDEAMQDYLEIWNWMFSLGRQPSGQAFQLLEQAKPMSGTGKTSEITLLVLDSNHNPAFQYVFEDAWPARLSGLKFDTTADGSTYMYASADFSYVRYVLEPITA